MKRKNLIPAVLLTLSLGAASASKAQKGDLVTPFRQGSVTVNLGVGVGNNYLDARNAFGTKAALEIGVFKAGPGVVSLGAEVGGTFSSKSDFVDRNDFRSRTFIVAGRSAWHYGWNVKRLDTYGGFSVGAGFRHHDYNKGNHISENDVVPVFGVFAGASYYFTPGFGVNVEVGRDVNTLQAGLIFKLR